MGKKKRSNAKRGGNRFFRWIRSDLPDEEDKKSPVLLLGVNKITDSPYIRRRSIESAHASGSIRFFRPPKSKYTRGLHGDERLEKIRQDLQTHKHAPDKFHIPNGCRTEPQYENTKHSSIKLNCAKNCACDQNKNSSNRGSFSFHRPENRQSSLCPSEPYVPVKSVDCSENEIEFKYTEHELESHPGSSKQNSYNVTPKSADRRSFLLANLNERFRKTLSLDSRKIETNRLPLSLPQEKRPKSLVNTGNIIIHNQDQLLPKQNFDKANQPKKKRKSFFSLEKIFDSRRSDSSSIDDFCSSKYKRFELESDDSPLFRNAQNREKTPDLLNLPVIIDSVRKKQTDTRRQLEKLENHYYNSLNSDIGTVIDAIPKDAEQGTSGIDNRFYYDDEVEYIEPIRSNFTSQSTLILEKNIPNSLLTINTDETDIKLPSSTVSPKSNDIDSIGPFEIEVRESDLTNDRCKDLTVKIMDKSIDSIGSCSLDVDASTDLSDTTSGSLNILTPSSTTSRIKDFTSRIQERASIQRPDTSLTPTPAITPIRTPEDQTPTPQRHEIKEPIRDNLLKPPPKVIVHETNHRSRSKKREEDKKPSYLHLACSVNGYTSLTTYDSKLRQDINRSREASPVRPITYLQYKEILVPVPVSAHKLIVPNFGPHDTRIDLTKPAPTKALTDPYLATSPIHVYMAAENKQLKNDFLGANMRTATSRPYMSSESKNFATSMLQDQVDNAKEVTFKSSYSETNFRKTNGSSETKIVSESFTIQHSPNGVSKRVEITKENGEKLTSPIKNLIQQRVERLYGPGALAQGFFNQKRHKTTSQSEDAISLLNSSFNTPSKQDYDYECSSPNGQASDLSLPVLRHLRPEFRAQLPILSPKKSPKQDISISPRKIDIPEKTPEKTKTEKEVIIKIDVEKPASPKTSDVNITNGVSVISLNGDSVVHDQCSNGAVNGVEKTNGCKEIVRDGYYFLELEKKETERLIALAVVAEAELESLQNNKDISEEIFGFLRSASGKARLLATQKMQQFEGLCYNNINKRSDEPFPTTCEDLRGFWDMVCLQVRNVEALFEQIAELKNNGWKEPSPPTPKTSGTPSPARVSRPRVSPATNNEKARLAAEKRDADRKAMLEMRRRVAREKQMAARSAIPGTSHEHQQDMGIEGSQEVEIFVGKTAKPSKVAPKGDCSSENHSIGSNHS